MRRGDERGSMAVEFVVLTPVLLLFALIVVAFGRYVDVRGDVDAAARDAARAASYEDTYDAARSAASRMVSISLDLNGAFADCGGAELGRSDFAPDGMIVVEISCRITLDDLGIIGMPGTVTIESDSAVPLERYREF